MIKITEVQTKALKRFKIKNGRYWKKKLKECWNNDYNYRNYFNSMLDDDISHLQQVRNLGINIDTVKL